MIVIVGVIDVRLFIHEYEMYSETFTQQGSQHCLVNARQDILRDVRLHTTSG